MSLPIPRNSRNQRIQVIEEMSWRNWNFNARVAHASLILVQVAYMGEPWISELKALLNNPPIKFYSTDRDIITPNMMAIRLPDYNIFATGGIADTIQVLDLAEGGANITPLYGIPGKVFGALWDVSDSCINFMQTSWSGINPQRKYFLCGHSMGNGLCSIIGARLMKQFNVPKGNIIGMYGFAGPKPGDPVFSDWLGEQYPSFTCIGAGDPTPLVPPAGAQYLWNIVDTVAPSNNPNQVRIEFSYQHVPKTYLLTTQGELETTDGAWYRPGLAISAIRAGINQLLERPNDVYDAHSIYTYLYNLGQMDYDLSGYADQMSLLLGLSSRMKEANPKYYQSRPAPTAEAYTNQAAPPPTPVIEPFNPVASGIPSLPAGSPATSRISGAIPVVPRLNVVPFLHEGLRAVDTSTRAQNYERGYDRRFLETLQLAIKNIRKQDGKKMRKGENANVMFPNDDISVSLAVVNAHIEELLSYNSGD